MHCWKGWVPESYFYASEAKCPSMGGNGQSSVDLYGQGALLKHLISDEVSLEQRLLFA